jgi:tetratricopeptide (TPR) repeat protein
MKSKYILSAANPGTNALAIAAIILLCAGQTASAWGPRTQAVIVSSASRILTQEKNIPLTRLQADIVRGCQLDGAELTKIVPLATANTQAAVEAEMYLLQAVRGDRVDPYMAFRLGVLGKLVADLTAPLSTSKSTLRTRYFADAEGAIEQISLRTHPRRIVDPQTYFAEVRRMADAKADLMVKDYEVGAGFGGVAGSSLSDDASRSIDAVADVWFTVLSGSVLVANISESQVRDFAVNALEFYVKRGNTTEADSTYNKLAVLGMQTVELRARIGDMFYAAGEFDRAVHEYESILEKDPGRKDVAAKLAAHFVTVGDKAMEAKELENAAEAYEKAASTDKLNAQAQVKVIKARTAIDDRNMRMGEAQQAIAEGQTLADQAEQEVRRNNFAHAMDLLTEADNKFASVTNEFVDLNRTAATSRSSVAARLQQIRDDLRNNSASLSGSGTASDVRNLAGESARKSAKAALEELIASQYAELAQQAAENQRSQLNSK